MKISEIFIGKPSDGFFRRYAFVLFGFAYVTALTKIWPNPLDRPPELQLAGGWIYLIGFISWYLAFKTRAAFKLLTSQYPGYDFTAYNASHLRLMGYAKKHSPESNVIGVSVDELKSFVKQLKKAKSSKPGIWSNVSEGFSAGSKATGSYGSSAPSPKMSNSVSPLSGNSELDSKASAQVESHSSKSLFQAKSVHALSGAVITSYREEDGYMTYKYKCEVCGTLDGSTNSHYNVTRGNVLNTTSLCANCKTQFKVIIDGS